MKDTYVVTVTVEDYNGIPGIIRLRSFLKAALRAWGIRCRRIEPLGDDSGIGRAVTPPAPPTQQRASGGRYGASDKNWLYTGHCAGRM